MLRGGAGEWLMFVLVPNNIGFRGIMEDKMETTIMGYMGYNIGDWANNIGIMEKKMETTFILLGGYYGTQ